MSSIFPGNCSKFTFNHELALEFQVVLPIPVI